MWRLGLRLRSLMMSALVSMGLTIDCAAVRRNIHRALDRRLTFRRAWQLRLHMLLCKRCFSRYEFARLLRRINKRQITEPRAPRALVRRVLAMNGRVEGTF